MQCNKDPSQSLAWVGLANLDYLRVIPFDSLSECLTKKGKCEFVLLQRYYLTQLLPIDQLSIPSTGLT